MARPALILGSRGLALLAGAALPLAFAPFGWWWLAAPLLALQFLLMLPVGPRERALRGFWFGAGCFAAGTWWLYISIHDFGGASPPFAVAVCGLLILVMALYLALWGFLCGLAGRACAPGWQLLAVYPATWVLVEWLRGWLFSGFPWLSLGYGQMDGPLQAWAPVAGVHGVSLVVLGLAGGLATLVAGAARERLAALVLLLALGAGTLLAERSSWVAPSGSPLTVALVQGGISQDRKWQLEELESTKALYRDRTVELDGADLIIWPEAAIPALAHEAQDYLAALRELARARDQQIILGILTFDFSTGEFRNSLLNLGEAGGVYHKRHLVPFGEYFPVPDFVRNFLRLMNLPYQDITAGLPGQPPLMAGGIAIAPTICYEDVFGTELREFLPSAGLLVNVSNDGWFGDSIAPHQHLEMARFRALEAGRYMLRSTNTGITAIIDPAGRVVARAPQFHAEVLTGQVRPYAGATPWVRFGNWPVLAACGLLLAAALAHVLYRSGRDRDPEAGL